MLAVVGGLVGFISVVALTDIIPIGQFSFSDFWQSGQAIAPSLPRG
jgi:hypothetical protein